MVSIAGNNTITLPMSYDDTSSILSNLGKPKRWRDLRPFEKMLVIIIGIVSVICLALVIAIAVVGTKLSKLNNIFCWYRVHKNYLYPCFQLIPHPCRWRHLRDYATVLSRLRQLRPLPDRHLQGNRVVLVPRAPLTPHLQYYPREMTRRTMRIRTRLKRRD